MKIETDAIVCALRNHGEHGAIVRLMTPENGLQAAYIRGARGRRMRPVLIPGNIVRARLHSRSGGELAQAEVELAHSRAPLLREPLPAGAIEWATVLTATALPEGQPFPRLHSALAGLLSAIEAAPSASGWGAALAQFELMMLADLGFGLDLERCAISGRREQLVAVSPKTGRAICRVEAAPYVESLLPLPKFLREGGSAPWHDIVDGLKLTGHFIARDLLRDRSAPMMDARGRLMEKFRVASGSF